MTEYDAIETRLIALRVLREGETSCFVADMETMQLLTDSGAQVAFNGLQHGRQMHLLQMRRRGIVYNYASMFPIAAPKAGA